MIIKKKRLNKANGLGDIPQAKSDAEMQYQSGEVSYAENYEQNIESENVSYVENYSEPAPSGNEQIQPPPPVSVSAPPPAQAQENPEEVDLFNLDNIDFTQRKERRRGDRRRGFRRVDDRNLVSRAREEADSIREAARKEGYQAGLEQVQGDLAEFRNAIAQFMNAPNDVYGYIAPDILEISVDIAQKIIKKEIEQDPQVLFNTIVDVLKTLSKEEPKVTLQVNPAEVNEVKQAVPELLDLAGLSTKVVVLPDEMISEGGCIVTTDNGVVDATIETRINLVSEALREL